RGGPMALTGIKVSTTYPFGLFVKGRVIPRRDVLLAYPARMAPTAALPKAARPKPTGEMGNPRQGGGNGDLLDLRELSPGDDSRRIHWVKSAGAGKLLRAVREREEGDGFTLRLETDLPSERLDRRCSEIAGLADRPLQRGCEVGLEGAAGEVRPGRGPLQQRRILEALAWAGFLPAGKWRRSVRKKFGSPVEIWPPERRLGQWRSPARCPPGRLRSSRVG